jgi:hypothetical protein
LKRIITLLLVFLSFLLLIRCEKKFDSLIDTSNHSYQVLSVAPKDSIIYNINDSSVVIKAQFSQSSKLNSVSVEILNPSGKKYLSNSLSLFDNGKTENGDLVAGDKIYSNKIFMKRNDLNGNYTVKYFVTDNILSNRLAAQSTFNYRNGETNLPPVISDAFIDPDTLIVTTTITIQTRIKVFDSNGLNDVKEVYFIVFRPDGTTNNIKTLLFDDGNVNDNGDLIAGDGIYSRKIQVNETNTKGTYRFEFRATDRGGLLSNIINYSVLIQ